MNYHGKLYGKIGNRYFELEMTTQDVEALRQKSLKNELTKVEENMKKATLADLLPHEVLSKMCTSSFDTYSVYHVPIASLSLGKLNSIALQVIAFEKGTDHIFEESVPAVNEAIIILCRRAMEIGLSIF